jgi:hypothetical protein
MAADTIRYFGKPSSSIAKSQPIAAESAPPYDFMTSDEAGAGLLADSPPSLGVYGVDQADPLEASYMPSQIPVPMEASIGMGEVVSMSPPYQMSEEEIRREEDRARRVREGAETFHSVAKSAAGAVMLPVQAMHTLHYFSISFVLLCIYCTPILLDLDDILLSLNVCL